jgi:hypothetical protein
MGKQLPDAPHGTETASHSPGKLLSAQVTIAPAVRRAGQWPFHFQASLAWPNSPKDRWADRGSQGSSGELPMENSTGLAGLFFFSCGTGI